MKSINLFISSALVAILTLCASCENKSDLHLPFTKPEFHIKAKYFYECEWQVVFTNNNFYTEDNLMECFDLSGTVMGNYVVHQLIIFKSEKEAVSFAEKFTTYKSCRMWNDSVSVAANALTAYRKQHPIQVVDNDGGVESCKNQEGNEVIVH